MSAHHTLSGTQAGDIASRVRLLRRRRLLTPHQAALADTLLWSARRPGSATLAASLAVLSQLAGLGARTAVRAVTRLEELGLIRRIRRRVRVAWNGSTASRQIANAYVLMPIDTECQRGTASKQSSLISIVEAPIAAAREAQEALNGVRSTRLKAIFCTKGALVCSK